LKKGDKSLGLVAFSPDGRTLLAAAHRDTFDRNPIPRAEDDGNQLICLWAAATGKVRMQLGGRRGHVSAFALSPDGKTLAASISGQHFSLWEVATGKERLRLKGGTQALAISPDGRLLASAGEGRTVRLWDLATGADRYRLSEENQSTNLAFSPDGRLLVGGSLNGTALVWDVRQLRAGGSPR
jgi:WD40 repeat protein